MRTVYESFQVVVCGGGLAGLCAAVAAARQGVTVALIHNRPVLGGNSSSEVGVTPHGAAAFHGYARETGILSELLIEERARNHAEIYENGWTNSVWDLVLYDLAVTMPGLTLHLNTDIRDVQMTDVRTIAAVVAVVHNAETELVITGKTFIDCTGDGLVADAADCIWRMGSEGREEFGEPHAPLTASALFLEPAAPGKLRIDIGLNSPAMIRSVYQAMERQAAAVEPGHWVTNPWDSTVLTTDEGPTLAKARHLVVRRPDGRLTVVVANRSADTPQTFRIATGITGGTWKVLALHPR
jgi:hypothetical protein